MADSPPPGADVLGRLNNRLSFLLKREEEEQKSQSSPRGHIVVPKPAPRQSSNGSNSSGGFTLEDARRRQAEIQRREEERARAEKQRAKQAVAERNERARQQQLHRSGGSGPGTGSAAPSTGSRGGSATAGASSGSGSGSGTSSGNRTGSASAATAAAAAVAAAQIRSQRSQNSQASSSSSLTKSRSHENEDDARRNPSRSASSSSFAKTAAAPSGGKVEVQVQVQQQQQQQSSSSSTALSSPRKRQQEMLDRLTKGVPVQGQSRLQRLQEKMGGSSSSINSNSNERQAANNGDHRPGAGAAAGSPVHAQQQESSYLEVDAAPKREASVSYFDDTQSESEGPTSAAGGGGAANRLRLQMMTAIENARRKQEALAAQRDAERMARKAERERAASEDANDPSVTLPAASSGSSGSTAKAAALKLRGMEAALNNRQHEIASPDSPSSQAASVDVVNVAAVASLADGNVEGSQHKKSSSNNSLRGAHKNASPDADEDFADDEDADRRGRRSAKRDSPRKEAGSSARKAIPSHLIDASPSSSDAASPVDASAHFRSASRGSSAGKNHSPRHKPRISIDTSARGLAPQPVEPETEPENNDAETDAENDAPRKTKEVHSPFSVLPAFSERSKDDLLQVQQKLKMLHMMVDQRQSREASVADRDNSTSDIRGGRWVPGKGRATLEADSVHSPSFRDEEEETDIEANLSFNEVRARDDAEPVQNKHLGTSYTNMDLTTFLEQLKDIRVMTDEELRVAIAKVKANPRLPRRARPQPPELHTSMPVAAQIKEVQRFIRSFEYNHTGENLFNTDKHRFMSRIMETARQIIATALPIKCLEAVVVGLYLTNPLPVERFALRFKSKVGGHSFWHIVLIVRTRDGLYGALGLSRRHTLDYKEIRYHSLSEVVQEYKRAYEEVGHTLRKITISLPFTSNPYSDEPVYWHFLVMPLTRNDWPMVYETMNRYMAEATRLMDEIQRGGVVHTEIGDAVRFNKQLVQLVYLAPEVREARAAERLAAQAQTSASRSNSKLVTKSAPPSSSKLGRSKTPSRHTLGV